MQLKITIVNAEENIESFEEFMRGIQGVSKIHLEKTEPSTMSIHDTISLLVQNPEAGVAIATGIGALFAALGNRARVTITKDGTIIAKGVSSKDAASIVSSAVRSVETPRK